MPEADETAKDGVTLRYEKARWLRAALPFGWCHSWASSELGRNTLIQITKQSVRADSM